MPEPLHALHRRLVAVLVEKALTTPEQYPLSSNSMAAGASQKSNRDPIMHVEENQVLDVLPQLRKRDLVELAHLTSGRVNRWKHRCREVWNVERPQLAIVTELILRGPQTLGELRTRASRMYHFETLEVVVATLASLSAPARADALVCPCPPVPGERAGRFRHTFYDPREVAALEKALTAVVTVPMASTPAAGADDDLAQRVADLERRVLDLEAKLGDWRA